MISENCINKLFYIMTSAVAKTQDKTLPLAFTAPLFNSIPTINGLSYGSDYGKAWQNIKENCNGDPLEMLCPVCGDPQIHFNDPKVKRGNDDYKASGLVRGDVIEIPMWCEHGHSFIFKMGFHKGSANLWVESTDVENNPETS